MPIDTIAPSIPDRRIGLAAFYNSVYSPRGFSLAPHHYPIVAGIEDRRIDALLVLCPPGAGKSNLLCSVYPAWELGHDPSLTIISVSAGEALPQNFMAATMQVIQNDPTFKDIFPEVRPAPEMGWSLQRGLFVKGHHPSDPDPSYAAFGISSKRLTGAHARLHIYDDIHDRENSRTPEQRAEVVNTYYDTLMGRGDPRHTRRIAVGRWWAADDVYQEWMGSGDWVVLELPATRPGSARLWYDVRVPRGLDCVFSETLEPEPDQDPSSPYIRYRAYYAAADTARKGFYWPGSPTKRVEYERVKRRRPRIAAINYDGDMKAVADAVFLETDFVPYLPPCDLSLGRAAPGFEAWRTRAKGEVEQAWDTALGQPQSSALTVALTGLLVPCSDWHCGEDPEVVGACDFHFDVYLLWAMVRHLDFRQLAMALRSEYAHWHPRMVTVEEKQSGVGILQTFRGGTIPLRGQMVQQGKIERAINPVEDSGKPIPGGAASVQGWGRMGRIRVPVNAPWIEAGPDGDEASGFIRRVLGFTGGLQGSDEFDALVHLVTRAIVLSRKHGRVGVAQPDSDLPIDPAAADDPRRMLLNAIGGLPVAADTAANPFVGMCGAPCAYYGIVSNQEWCALHGRRTNAISGCGSWSDQRRAA